jgi:MOSC domain-containing protein YiiM
VRVFPCKTIKASFIDGKFIRIAQKLHPGWSRVYARVLSEGQIHFGDPSKSTQGPNNKGRAAPRTAPLLNSRTDPTGLAPADLGIQGPRERPGLKRSHIKE